MQLKMACSQDPLQVCNRHGTVEETGTTATLVETTFTDDPLFDGVDPVVVALYGITVTEPGNNMEIIASADHARVFGTAHRSAPSGTVQFHPELTVAHRDQLVEDFGWQAEQFSFEDVTAERIFENFVALATETAE